MNLNFNSNYRDLSNKRDLKYLGMIVWAFELIGIILSIYKKNVTSPTFKQNFVIRCDIHILSIQCNDYDQTCDAVYFNISLPLCQQTLKDFPQNLNVNVLVRLHL